MIFPVSVNRRSSLRRCLLPPIQHPVDWFALGPDQSFAEIGNLNFPGRAVARTSLRRSRTLLFGSQLTFCARPLQRLAGAKEANINLFEIVRLFVRTIYFLFVVRLFKLFEQLSNSSHKLTWIPCPSCPTRDVRVTPLCSS